MRPIFTCNLKVALSRKIWSLYVLLWITHRFFKKKKWNSDKDISLSDYTWWVISWVNSIISDGFKIIKSQPIPNIMLQCSLHKEFYLGSPRAPSSEKIGAKWEKGGQIGGGLPRKPCLGPILQNNGLQLLLNDEKCFVIEESGHMPLHHIMHDHQRSILLIKNNIIFMCMNCF